MAGLGSIGTGALCIIGLGYIILSKKLALVIKVDGLQIEGVVQDPIPWNQIGSIKIKNVSRSSYLVIKFSKDATKPIAIDRFTRFHNGLVRLFTGIKGDLLILTDGLDLSAYEILNLIETRMQKQ